jgi:hypothetical protein
MSKNNQLELSYSFDGVNFETVFVPSPPPEGFIEYTNQFDRLLTESEVETLTDLVATGKFSSYKLVEDIENLKCTVTLRMKARLNIETA